MKPGVVVLPKVFAPDSVELGQFLPNPLYPTTRALRPTANRVPPTAITQSEPEEDYKTVVCLGKEGHSNIKVLRLIGAKLGGEREDYLHISADACEYTFIRDPDAVFAGICADDPNARIWMQDMAVYGKPFYMVVGIQTVKDAVFTRRVISAVDAGADFSAYLDPHALLKIKAGAGGSSTGFGSAVAKTTGILGIEVRRVDCQIKTKEQLIRQRQQQKSQQTTLLPVALSDHIHWAYSYQQKKGGPGDQTDQQVCAELQQDNPEPEGLEGLFQAELQQQISLEDSDED